MSSPLDLLGGLAETAEIRSLMADLAPPPAPPRPRAAAGRPRPDGARSFQAFAARINWRNDPAFRAPDEAPLAAVADPDGASPDEDGPGIPLPAGAVTAGAFFALVNWKNAAERPAWPARARPSPEAPRKKERPGESFNVANVLASIQW